MKYNIFVFILALCFVGFSQTIVSDKSGNWSNPSTWVGGTVPGQNDNVLIDSSHTVVYDVNKEEPIRKIHVRGKLSFSRDENTLLNVGMLLISDNETVDEFADCSAHMQHGHNQGSNTLSWLEVGSFDNPIPSGVKATIKLTYFEGLPQDCAPAIINYGGRMDFHGSPLLRTWTKLNEDANSGDTFVNVADNVSDWNIGDRIIITRSNPPGTNFANDGSFLTNGLQQTEERFIANINGNQIEFDSPLNFDHPLYRDGEGNVFSAEVANLSRNVVIESSDPDGITGHTMWHFNSKGAASYTEFVSLGKRNVLARYPLHYHILRGSNRGTFWIGLSVRESENRAYTVHSTDYVLVKDCISYKTVGHAFYLEDATESFNLIHRNLAVLAYDFQTLPNQALPYDENEGAGFWWAQARNAFIENVGAECDQYGFQFDIRDNIITNIPDHHGNIETGVRASKYGTIRFQDNEAHSTMKYGFFGTGNSEPDNPFHIQGLKIWNLWYAFSPDNLWNMWADSVHIYNTAYGFYGQEPKTSYMNNFRAIDTGNYGLGYIARPEGLMLVENALIGFTSGNDYWLRFSGRKDRDISAEVHVRNYTIQGFSAMVETHTGVDPEQKMTLYLHGENDDPSNPDKVVIHEDQLSNHSDMGLNFQSEAGYHSSLLTANSNVDWPENPMTLTDSLPPIATILSPFNGQIISNTGTVKVWGYAIDDNKIVSVKVNGKEVTPLENNYLYWEVDIDVSGKNQVTLTTEVIDENGFVELNPHSVTIQTPGSDGNLSVPTNVQISK